MMKQSISQAHGHYSRIRREFWEKTYLVFLVSDRIPDSTQAGLRQAFAANQADEAMREWDKRFIAGEPTPRRRRRP